MESCIHGLLPVDSAQLYSDNLPYAFYERTAGGTVQDITDELPFEIPGSWEWVRLGSVFNLQAGKFIKADDIYSEPKNRYPCYGCNGLLRYVDKYNHANTAIFSDGV